LIPVTVCKRLNIKAGVTNGKNQDKQT